MNACDKCPRSAECQQGKRCHLDTSITDRAGALVIVMAGTAAICAVVIEAIAQLGR